jgi:hypothetical protein
LTVLLASLVAVAFGLMALTLGALLGRGGLRGTCHGLSATCDKQGRPLCDGCPNRGLEEDPAGNGTTREVEA